MSKISSYVDGTPPIPERLAVFWKHKIEHDVSNVHHSEIAPGVLELDSRTEFCKEEITRFEHYLEGVVNNTNDVVVRAEVKHFKDGFIRERKVIVILKYKLHTSGRQLAAFVKELSGLGLKSIKMDNHTKLRDDVKTFRRI